MTTAEAAGADVPRRLCPCHGGGVAPGHQRLEPAPAPEDDGAILRFFCQLSDKLAEAATRVIELTNTK
jgi:hypothetical protein